MRFKNKLCLGCGILLLTFLFDAHSQESSSVISPLKTASQPSRFFSIPSAEILRSSEIAFSGGGAFGVDGGSKLLRNLIIGLGGIAEVEMTTSGMTNRFTGKSETLPTSSFKVSLIPERLKKYNFIPDLAIQLRSASWQHLQGDRYALQAEYKTYQPAMNGNLYEINQVKKRFSVLYVIAGKRFPGIGNIQGGVSETDVRTQGGYQTKFDQSVMEYITIEIPELKKRFLSPFCGIEIVANESTQLMAEIQSIPLFDYNFYSESIEISNTWLLTGGIRFFLTEWISLDTGIKYQSDYQGIADAEIDIGMNFVIPVGRILKK